MDDAGRVGGVEGVAEEPEQPGDPLGPEPPLPGEQELERHAGDVLEDQARAERVVQGGLEEPHGVRVGEVRHRADFGVEELAEPGQRDDVLVDPLDDHRLVRVAGRRRQEHLGVAPPAQGADQAVLPEGGGPDHSVNPERRAAGGRFGGLPRRL